jgi:hypothetical protein
MRPVYYESVQYRSGILRIIIADDAALAPEEGRTIQESLREANAVLYRANTAGRDGVIR